MYTRFWSVIIMLTLSSLSQSTFAKSAIQGDMVNVSDTAHLEFKGAKNWRYEVQRDPASRKVSLTIPAIDDASSARIGAFTSPLVSSVEINRNGPDGSYLLTFHVTGNDVETFDYLTDEPSRLIIDFYKKIDEPKVEIAQVAAPIASSSKELPKKVSSKQAALPKKNVAKARKPAGDELLSVVAEEKEKVAPVALRFGIFDGGDDNYDRFRIKDYEIREEAIVASRQNIYLSFPMLKMPVSQLQEIMDQEPEYVIRPQDTRENKEARLLLVLFERGRDAVFLRTFDYFTKKYPESAYTEIVKNVAADVQLKRWKESGDTNAFEAARTLYKELIEKYPSSPLRERNSLLLSFALMEHGEALSTLQTMQNFLERFPSSKAVPQIRKGMAEALIVLRKYEEAADQYKAIAKEFPKSTHAFEARYRMGDVWFAKGDYNRAIQTYEAVIKELPQQEKIFANANYNLAEASFWQKDFKRALNHYVQFVNNFPTSSHGGFALTRIGEILAILGADQRRVMGAYLESYFRFPTNSGAEVARIRMLSQQMRGMKAKELKKALEEIEGITKRSALSGVPEFTTLMTAEGLQNRSEFIPALEQLIAYYQKNPGSLNLDAFRSRILRNIANEIKARVERDDFIGALEFNSKYAATWLKSSDRIDIPFYIANAYEVAGAYGEANKLYVDSLHRRKSIVGTEREKERNAHENLPSVDSLHLRVAATAFASRNYMESFQSLKDIKDGKALSAKEMVERVQLAAAIYMQKNDVANAKKALTELSVHWQGDVQLLSGVHQQLAEMHMASKDFKAAEESANKVIAADSKESPVSEKLLIKAYQTKADAMLADGRSLAAAEVLQTLLEKFEGTQQLGVTRYKLGKILFDRGDVNGAEAVWQRLAGTSSDFLYKLGSEKLKSAQWQDDYNKYTKRIPAMVQDQKQESKQ